MPLSALGGNLARDLAFQDLCSRLSSILREDAHPEFVFHPTRKFRFDLAFPESHIALEINGAVFQRKGAKRCHFCGNIAGGGHTYGKGAEKDMLKRNLANIAGWTVLEYQWREIIETPDAIAKDVQEIMHLRGKRNE